MSNTETRHLGTRDPHSYYFCCHWEVWAHLHEAAASCHLRELLLCPFLQAALPAPLGASAAPKFRPSCTAVLGNNQWRNTRWKRSMWEAFSQKTEQKALLAPWIFAQWLIPGSPHPAEQAGSCALSCLLSMPSTPCSPWAHGHSPEWGTVGSSSESGFGHTLHSRCSATKWCCE